MSSAGTDARRAGTDGIHSVLSGQRRSGEIRFVVGGGRPKADHAGLLVKRLRATVPSIDDFVPAVVFQAAFAASSALASAFDRWHLSEQKYGMHLRHYDDLTRFPGLRQMLREYPQAPFMICGCKLSRGILWRRPRQALIGFRGIADHSLFAGATLSATPAIASNFSPTSEAISSTGT